MSILVTGGYGHIGSWVTRVLVGKGKDVLIFDRSRRSLSYLESLSDQIKFIEGDVLDQPRIFDTLKPFQNDIEGIIHIAGLMGGPRFAENPHQNVMINLMGTLNILEASRIFGIRKIVYISSGAVYGERDDIPDENTPMAPSDLYGAAKGSSELLGLQYANEFGTDFRIARVYFVYGPGRLPSELYPLYRGIFGCLEEGVDKVRLEAGNDQEIDYTYVKDVAQGIVLLYEKSSVGHRIFNFVSGSHARIPDIIDIVSRFKNSPLDIEIGPGKIMPRGPSLSIHRARKELGFSPAYTLEDGIEEYAQWIREYKRSLTRQDSE